MMKMKDEIKTVPVCFQLLESMLVVKAKKTKNKTLSSIRVGDKNIRVFMSAYEHRPRFPRKHDGI